MYSKRLLIQTIERKLKEQGISYYRIAKELEIPQSNLMRALNTEGYNLTLAQFAQLVQLLELSESEVHNILIPKNTTQRTKPSSTAALKR